MTNDNPAPAGNADPDAAPIVTDYTPQGSADVNGGDTITITGSGFQGVTSVAVGPYAGYFTVVSDTEIQFTAPPYGSSIVDNPASAKLTVWKDTTPSGTNDLLEWTWGGQTRQDLQAANGQADAAAQAAMDVDPEVTEVQPGGSADVAGGDNVVINGSGLIGATGVAIGPFAAYFTVASDTQIVFTAPPFDAAAAEGWTSAKVTVWKDAQKSGTNDLAEWTWAGQTIEQLLAAGGQTDDQGQGNQNDAGEGESPEEDAEEATN